MRKKKRISFEFRATSPSFLIGVKKGRNTQIAATFPAPPKFEWPTLIIFWEDRESPGKPEPKGAGLIRPRQPRHLPISQKTMGVGSSN